MTMMTKDKALELLDDSIPAFFDLPSSTPLGPNEAPLIAWRRTALVCTEAIFGPNSKQARELELQISSYLETLTNAQCARVLGLILSFREEIGELWTDRSAPPPEPLRTPATEVASAEMPVDPESKEVCVIHGHDDGRKESLARFLEKLDVGAVATAQDQLKPRVRQNVVLELGCFLAKLGRRRTCALVAAGVEIPSDYSGVIYITIDDANAWRLLLAKKLEAAGLPIDMNRVL